MALNQCGTYSTDTYCQCYSQEGQNTPYFKQFNEDKQIFFCCNYVEPSLVELRNWKGTGNGELISGDAFSFFSSILENGLTGCCYLPYFQDPIGQGPSSQTNLEDNYPDLNNSYQTILRLYNQFVATPKEPPTQVDGGISCPLPDTNPYILSYKTPGQVYQNFSYVCLEDADVGTNLKLNGTNIEYDLNRFVDKDGNQCQDNFCSLEIPEFGNIVNMGNQPPFYSNNPKSTSSGAIVSLVFSVILLILSCYLLFHNFKIKRKRGI